MNSGALNFPQPGQLVTNSQVVHFHFIADAVFQLKRDLLESYLFRYSTHEMRIYNCRFSRARSVMENAFVILTHRLRVSFTTINLVSEIAEDLVLRLLSINQHSTVNHWTPIMRVEIMMCKEDGEIRNSLHCKLKNQRKLEWRSNR